MAKKIKFIVAVSAALAAFAVIAEQVICPMDNWAMVFTGNTKTFENGRIGYEYKCSNGHSLWVFKQ